MPSDLRERSTAEISHSLTVLGCGEAFDQDLPNTSLLLRTPDSTVLFDCGYSVPQSYWAEAGESDDLDAVWLSHMHADHAMGVPALLGRMWEEGRSRPLTLLGGAGVAGRVAALFENGYPSLPERIKFRLDEVAVEPNLPVSWRDLTFRSAETIHGVRNLAVRVESERSGAFTYSGDGSPTTGSASLVRNAYWVQECYSEGENQAGHAGLLDIVRLLAEAQAIRLGIVHVARERKNRVAARVAEMAANGVGVEMLAPGDRKSI